MGALKILAWTPMAISLVIASYHAQASSEVLEAPNQFINPIVSLQFTNIPVKELLQVLAGLGKTNFLLSESIAGEISIELNNTSWLTALHSILASRGLRLVRNGDIYWIGPHSEIQAFQKFRHYAVRVVGPAEQFSPPPDLPPLVAVFVSTVK